MFYVTLTVMILALLAALVAIIWMVVAPDEAKAKAYLYGGVLLLVSLVVAWFSWGAVQRASKVDQCAENVSAIGAAAEVYASGHDGVFPASLEELMPFYFDELPLCPLLKSQDENSYVSGYQVSDEGFTVMCSGHHHQGFGGAAENRPAYSCELGGVVR